MRIVFVNNYCGRFGGVEQNVADVARGLRELGHHCTLVYRAEAEQAAAYRAHFDAAIASGGGADLTRCLQSLADGTGVDVIYVHKLDAVIPLLPLQGRVRLVRMFHDHDECCPRRHKYFTFSTRICNRPMGWRCWVDLAFVERDRGRRIGLRCRSLRAHKRELAMNRHIFDAVLVASRFMRDELAMNGFAGGRIHCLAPCVRLPEQPLAAAPDNNEILFVGQLIKGKGVDLLLDAVARLRQPWCLTIAGDGNARTALERQAANLGIASAVSFPGWVSREALDVLYENCRILAVPSRWAEPFGMIGLEAMHRARPVVGFAVGGIPDWLEDGVNGYAVPERNIPAFAAALATLLDDIGLTRAMGERGRRKLDREFAYDRYLANLLAVLQGKETVAQ